MSREKDIVEDMFSRVKAILGNEFKGEIILKLEQEEQRIRMDWGGTEPYIPKKKDRTELKKTAIKLLNSGVPIKKVVNDTGICRTDVYMLLKRRK